jgi:hypothetical protein
MYKYIKPYIELAFLTIASLLLYFFPIQHSNAFSFCVFKMLGFNGCFGCGIGHAIHHALQGNWQASFQEHIMGIPAVTIFLYRIIYIIISTLKQPKHHEFFKRYSQH